MSAIVPNEQFVLVHKFKKMLSRYQRNHDLIAVGAYTPGNDPQIDEAIEKYPWLEAYLQQGIEMRVDYDAATSELETLLGQGVQQRGMNHG
jgi:flagellum-specific ATP synthase